MRDDQIKFYDYIYEKKERRNTYTILFSYCFTWKTVDFNIRFKREELTCDPVHFVAPL